MAVSKEGVGDSSSTCGLGVVMPCLDECRMLSVSVLLRYSYKNIWGLLGHILLCSGVSFASNNILESGYF